MTGELAVLIEGRREDWPGGPRTLMPRSQHQGVVTRCAAAWSPQVRRRSGGQADPQAREALAAALAAASGREVPGGILREP